MSSNKRQIFAGLPTIETDDHEEKSSQRVPGPYALLLLGFYLLLTYIIKIVEDDMPAVIRERDIARHDSNTFSEESAKIYLNRILGDQPRVAGTVEHFVKTRDMKYLLDEIASEANIPIRTDWQYVSGDYWLAFNSPYVNCYQNVSNVIALLEGESGFHPNGTIGTSLLVNCHYDSVPFAIGASDNGVFCAAMAETLSKLSRRKKKLKHNIVFLFNGAEENVLLASHGFLSHPWAKGVTNVVNLDSAGMNGIPSLFQVTDARVLDVYKRTCSRPNAQGLGEVLFASGIIPSDTDFRIFRDFEGIHGIDLAFIKGGNVYHTRNDRPELILDGVIQNAGDMLLSLVRELADRQELEIKKPQSTAVYFDYIGLFLVTYSSSTALVVDLLVAVLGLSSVAYFLWLFGHRRSSVIELLWSAVGRVVCVLAGVAAVALLTVVMVATTTQMRYLSHQWMVIPLYIGPFIIAMTVTSHKFDSWRSSKSSASRSTRACRASSSSRALQSLSLLLLCAAPRLSTVRYVLSAPLLLISLGSFVSMTLVRYRKLKGWQHLLLEVLLSLPATSMCISLSLRLLPMVVPIMGRAGADNPDYAIAAVSVVLATLAVITIHVCLFAAQSGAELLLRGGRVCVPLCALTAAAVLWPAGPYGGLATQRHYWFHTQITTYNANFTPIETVSGVIITKLDPYSVQSALKAIKDSPLYVQDSDTIQIDSQMKKTDSHQNNEARQNNAFKITDSDLNIFSPDKCEKYVYCNLPLYRTRFDRFMKGSLFITMGPPEEFEHSLKLVNRSCVEDSCVLRFIMNGPAYNTLIVWPRPNVTLSGWSFASAVKATMMQNNRPVFVITQATSTYSDVFKPLNFTLTFSVPQHLQTDILVDITHNAHRVHHPQHFTAEYKMLLDVMPEYLNIASMLSFRDNYVF